MCFSCMEKGVHKSYEVVTDDKNGSYWFGTWVTTIRLGDNLDLSRGDLMNPNNRKSYGLALPCPSKKANKIISGISKLNERPVYHIITCDWTERTCCNGTVHYKIPKVFGCKYN